MAATLIPYSWIAAPLNRRPDAPVNAPVITQNGGVVGYSIDQASIDRYGLGAPEITLDTACDGDPATLAVFFTMFRSTPRARQLTVAFDRAGRTDAEWLQILAVGFGQWVQLSDSPDSWPPAATNFTVVGIQDVLAADNRVRTWQTVPVIGSDPTAPGPWFTWDSSDWDGADIRPF